MAQNDRAGKYNNLKQAYVWQDSESSNSDIYSDSDSDSNSNSDSNSDSYSGWQWLNLWLGFVMP